MQKVIKINNLNYLNIFHDFTISFDQNKLIFISGPSNCGKTTLLKILGKNLIADGNIEILDKSITEYKITDYYKILKTVIPSEYTAIYDNVEDEINYHISQLFLNKQEKNKRLRNIYKSLGLNKYKKELIKNLEAKDLIRLQLASVISSMPKIILIDDLSPFFTVAEMHKMLCYFKYLTENYDITIIVNTSRLDEAIDGDYLFIVENSNIVVEGEPIEVLQKDNVLNKVGLRVPFMIDLSVKLKDYDLVDNIELDMNRMIETLWK